MKNITFWLIGAIILLIIGLTYFVKRSINLKADRDRIENNFSQVTQDNAVLNVTIKEFKTIQTKDTEKIDSLLKALKIKPRFVTGATVINTVYRDTSKTPAIVGDPIEQTRPVGSIEPPMWEIPTSLDSSCWGFKGEIITTDPESRLNILEKNWSNSNQLIVIRPKYFLGFLWRVRPGDYLNKTDCGESKFTSIEFKK